MACVVPCSLPGTEPSGPPGGLGGVMDDAGRASFDEFFDHHYVEVVRALALVVGDRARAEDAAQEAFAQAYRRWSRVVAMDRPVGWVIVVGVNRLKRDLARAERA